MSLYKDYINEIEERKGLGLHPKPIDGAELLSEVISQIKDVNNEYRADSVNFFIYNTLPGTTPAAGVKAKFLKEIILGEATVAEITPTYAFELLSHMKGGPSIEVLLDLALGNDEAIAKQAAAVLKTQVFLYDADTARLADAYNTGNAIAKDILESCWKRNPDGAGFMFNDCDKVVIMKGFMTFEEFYLRLQTANEFYHLKEKGLVIHFRIATSGLKDKGNCHPYPISNDNLDLRKSSVLSILVKFLIGAL